MAWVGLGDKGGMGGEGGGLQGSGKEVPSSLEIRTFPCLCTEVQYFFSLDFGRVRTERTVLRTHQETDRQIDR